MAKYRQILDEVRKPGVWQTKAGKWAGKRPDGSTQYGMGSKDTATAYVAGKDVEDGEDKPKKKSSTSERPEAIEGINDSQTELENQRDMGVAGAGGPVASQGEARYCNAMNTHDDDKFKKENAENIQRGVEALKSGKTSINTQMKKDLEALSLDPNSDGGREYLATREVFANKELERIKGIKDSVFYKSGKTGFGGDEEAYKEWMRAGYDGALATRKILSEDTAMDLSKPNTTMQSEKDIDDKVANDLEKKINEAKLYGSDDLEYYEQELKDFQHFRKYHDTYTVGQDKNGRTHIVSISNKKGSDLRDPQNNTTPKARFGVIKENYGTEVAEKVTGALDSGIEQVSDTKMSAVKKGNDTEIDDSVAAICDTPEMEKYVEKLDTNKKFQEFASEKGKSLENISTKEKLQLMQEHSKEMISAGEKPAYEPYGKIWTKMGELSRTKKFQNNNSNIDFNSKSVQTSIDIKQAEKDAVSTAHKEVVSKILEADGGTRKAGEDNGKHTQGYINTVMDAMHFNSYIDGGDGKMIVQMGIRGGQPSQVRGCLAEQSGFKGDTGSKEGKEALKEHLRKKCRIDEDNGNIIIQDNDKTRVLAMDTWRTAGTSQKVASGFGDDMRDCLTSKIDEKRASKKEKTEGYQSLEGLISRRYLV